MKRPLPNGVVVPIARPPRPIVDVAIVDVAVKFVDRTLPDTTRDDEAYTMSLNHTGIVVEGVRTRVL